MAIAMGADRGKAGLATVLRAPGTYNFKRNIPELVTAEVGDARVDPAQIDAAVPREQPKARPQTHKKRAPWTVVGMDSDFELVCWMNAHGIPYGAEVLDGKGRKWRLEECPVAPPGKEHSDGVYVGQYDDGAVWFQCYHDHGEGVTWQDVRPIFEPGCYVPWWVKVVSKNA